MGFLRLPGEGVATRGASEAFGGLWCVEGRHFTEPYPAHLHARFIVAAIVEGTLDLRTARGLYRANPGSVVVLNPWRVHAEWWHRGSFASVMMTPSVVSAATGGQWNWEEMAFPDPVILLPSLASRVRAIHDGVSGGMAVSQVEGMVSELLRLLQQIGGRRGVPSRDPNWLRTVFDQLHAVPAMAPRIEELARAAGRSMGHTIRSFTRHVGLPPHAYHEQRRIAIARELLAVGRPSAEIATELGYCDQSHFTRSFRRSVLVPPRRYAALLDQGAGRRRLAAP